MTAMRRWFEERGGGGAAYVVGSAALKEAVATARIIAAYMNFEARAVIGIKRTKDSASKLFKVCTKLEKECARSYSVSLVLATIAGLFFHA